MTTGPLADGVHQLALAALRGAHLRAGVGGERQAGELVAAVQPAGPRRVRRSGTGGQGRADGQGRERAATAGL